MRKKLKTVLQGLAPDYQTNKARQNNVSAVKKNEIMFLAKISHEVQL